MPAPVVLHVRNSDRYGGPERLIVEGALRTRETLRPVIASFVRRGAPNALLNEATRRGLETLPLPERRAVDRRALRALSDGLRATGAALAVGHDYKGNWALRRTAKGAGIPWAALVHGYTGENAKVRLFEALDRRGLRRAAAVVVVAQAVRARVLRAGVDPRAVRLVENGVDVAGTAAGATAGRSAVRASLGVADGEVLCVSIGRLSPEKGHRVLLEAWALLGAAAPRLVLVGDGAARADLEARARRLPPGQVVFAGWQADPTAWVGAADVAILPSLTEGLPLALLEAMAAGTAVVATRVGGMPAALDEGRAGLLVPPGDPRALASAVEELSDSADGRRRLAAAAREVAWARYDVARQAEALADVWKVLLRSAPSGR